MPEAPRRFRAPEPEPEPAAPAAARADEGAAERRGAQQALDWARRRTATPPLLPPRGARPAPRREDAED
jgi:hypothetical protein